MITFTFMTSKLARHGTQAGYKAEVARGTESVCNRCRNAHRVYNRQFTPTGKKKGLKYGVHEVIDYLYSAESPGAGVSQGGAVPSDAPVNPAEVSAEPQGTPSLSQRLTSLIESVRTPESGSPEYVPSDEGHSYITEVDSDPSPEGWEPEDNPDGEFVVNPAGMKKIEENLGFYLATVGMTLEIIDPYCGGIAAQNANEIIKHWSKVIAHYPKTANFFLSEKGGAVFLWINALQATWPLLYAIYEHHLSRSVQVKDGVAYRAKAQAVPNATMPPDNYDYTTR